MCVVAFCFIYWALTTPHGSGRCEIFGFVEPGSFLANHDVVQLVPWNKRDVYLTVRPLIAIISVAEVPRRLIGQRTSAKLLILIVLDVFQHCLRR